MQDGCCRCRGSFVYTFTRYCLDLCIIVAIVVCCNRCIVTKIVVIIISGVNRSASEKFHLVTQLILIRLVSIGAIKQVVFANYCLLYEAFVLHYFISRSQNRR